MLPFGFHFEQLTTVSVSTGVGLVFGTEVELPVRDFLNRSLHRGYDISPDGERFIAVYPEEPIVPVIHFVQNWFEELNERVPVP